LLAVALLAGCATLSREPRTISPLAFPFEGPGRLVTIWRVETAGGGLESQLVVYDADGALRIPITGAVAARWLDSETLLVSLEVESEDPAAWGLTEIVGLHVDESRLVRLMAPRRHYDFEVSPDRTWLALGVDVNDQGDSDLEIWYLGESPQVVASRREALDAPRWSPDGVELIVSRALQDPDAETSDTSVSVGSVGLAWPRLFRLRRDLGTSLQPVSDGDGPGRLIGGGSLPLWWDAAGIWARQRRGLVRCDPGGEGCDLIYSPGEDRRVLEGRRVGADEALLLVMQVESRERLATEVHRVSLVPGAGSAVFQLPPGSRLSGLDWTP
jgi:hypothetical protein